MGRARQAAAPLGPGRERMNWVIVSVFVYLIVVALALWLWLQPRWRERAWAVVGCRWALAGEGVRRVIRRVGQHGGGWLAPAVRGAGDLLAVVHSWRWWWWGAFVLLIAVPSGALLLRQWLAYDGFDHTSSREANAQIAELLRGEQLVPPPRLPPELFATREVELAYPQAATASRQWELLDPDFRQRLLLVFKLMREQHGIEMVLIEGWRSPERQAKLAGMGPAVTHAGAGQSYHQVGLAADCAFMQDGRILISERDPWAAKAYQAYGVVAQSLGLTWGGSWSTLVDLGHVEWRRPGALVKAPA